VIATLLVALGIASVLILYGSRDGESAQSTSAASSAPVTEEEQGLITVLDGTNRKYSILGVPAADQIATVQGACAYLEDEEALLEGPEKFMASVLTSWSAYGAKFEREFTGLRPWLIAGMTQICPKMAYRMKVIEQSGALPPRVNSATAEALGEGRVEFRWRAPDWIPEALDRSDLTVPVVFEYRVDAGEWTATNKSNVVLDGLEPGARAFLEVRIVYGAPSAGGPYGEAFGMPVRIE
jgi:hypothetical protein